MRPYTLLPLSFLLASPVWAEPAAIAPPAIVRFAIERFQVEGNTLLKTTEIDAALAPHTGVERDFGDVQRALEALEGLYRQRGYSTIYVTVPEQELSAGMVRFRVVEGRIGTVTVTGNQFFSSDNIRAALPALKEGTSPLAERLSENIQLANENPAKQAEVILAAGDAEGEVNAKVNVVDQPVSRVSVSIDNTGSPATGQNRTGVAYQHHNVGDRDQSFTAAYTTSLDKPEGVDVDIYSFGYRIPLYDQGDSIDLIYANSTTGLPSSSPSLGGVLGIVGKGRIYGARWNILLPRQGEYSSRVVLAIDGKDMDSSCTTPGGVLTGVAGCEPYYVQPLSVTYHGRLDRNRQLIGYSAGFATNTDHSDERSYDLASGNRHASSSFLIGRLAGSFIQAFSGDWQVRLNGQAQFTRNVLVPTEQIGLAGSTAVRGFQERAVATDLGHMLQAELHTPDMAAGMGVPGNLRFLGFYDFARGKNLDVAAGQDRFGIASAGLGLRYNYSRDYAWRFDLAHVLDSYSPLVGGVPVESKWRAHFGLNVNF